MIRYILDTVLGEINIDLENNHITAIGFDKGSDSFDLNTGTVATEGHDEILKQSLSEWIQSVIQGQFIKEPYPFLILGTPFQQQVWQYLTTIPYGQTQTYTQVAQGIGKPKAVRAVASACAMNKLAVVIPCHRVIRTSGSLAGYRWGLDNKKNLLKYEVMQQKIEIEKRRS